MVVVVALLFLAAGRPDWPGGWLIALLLVVSQAAQWLIVAPRHPDLLAERSRVGPGVDRRDVPLAMAMAYGPFVAMLVAALQVRIEGLADPPLLLVVAGLGISLLGIAITVVAMMANRFFASIVRIQVERGHHVVDDGPYRLVRHPGYAGAILFVLGLPALLASWWSLPAVIVTVALDILRTAHEDRYLLEHLEGYDAYAATVPWRLMPRAW